MGGEMTGEKGLAKALDESLDILAAVIEQACGDRKSAELDSMALTAYADGLRLLARYHRVTITHEYGRRVIAEHKRALELIDEWERGDSANNAKADTK